LLSAKGKHRHHKAQPNASEEKGEKLPATSLEQRKGKGHLCVLSKKKRTKTAPSSQKRPSSSREKRETPTVSQKRDKKREKVWDRENDRGLHRTLDDWKGNFRPPRPGGKEKKKKPAFSSTKQGANLASTRMWTEGTAPIIIFYNDGKRRKKKGRNPARYEIVGEESISIFFFFRLHRELRATLTEKRRDLVFAVPLETARKEKMVLHTRHARVGRGNENRYTMKQNHGQSSRRRRKGGGTEFFVALARKKKKELPLSKKRNLASRQSKRHHSKAKGGKNFPHDRTKKPRKEPPELALSVFIGFVRGFGSALLSLRGREERGTTNHVKSIMQGRGERGLLWFLKKGPCHVLSLTIISP